MNPTSRNDVCKRSSKTVSAALAVCAVVVGLGALACDDPGKQANDKITDARREADKKAVEAQRKADEIKRGAQADANEKITDAKASFAKTREDYRHDLQTKIDKLDKKLGDLDTKAMKETGKAKSDLDVVVTDVKRQRDALGADIKRIDDATASDWEALKARIEKGYDDLERSVDKAL
jgi:hypothetical protein